MAGSAGGDSDVDADAEGRSRGCAWGAGDWQPVSASVAKDVTSPAAHLRRDTGLTSPSARTLMASRESRRRRSRNP